MLPELLFSVGSSMQDISRDDFSLLNGGCDKDISSRITPQPQPLESPIEAGVYNATVSATTPPPTNVSSISPNLDNVTIKLEESSQDLYGSQSWHHSHHHHHRTEISSNKLLLQSSDDPLISRGATTVDDDNPNELSSIVAAASNAAANNVTAPAATTTLRRTTRNTAGNANGTPKTRRKGAFKLRFHHQALPAEYLNHYEAAQKEQDKIAKESSKNVDTNPHETVRNWLQKISDMQVTSNEYKEDVPEELHTEQQQTTCPVAKGQKKVVKYSDLPYMGEMTLENSKPRRGRKPKKADICHLIYKNYGTIFPGTPKGLMDVDKKDDVKDSLLEKRLSSDKVNPAQRAGEEHQEGEEPLNLCLRDQSTDSFTISSEGEDSDDPIMSNRTTPLTTPTDPATDALLAANLKMSLPNFQSALLDKSSDEAQTPSTADSDQTPSPNYVYWPAAGIFIHPMALYYQKMIDAGTLPPSLKSAAQAATTPITLPSPQTTQVIKKQGTSKQSISKSAPVLVKKDKAGTPEPCSTPSSTKSSGSATNSTNAKNPQPPQKRKRSAIFIPPMPAENTTNPATEVSICKFKFTGGAKPSLQEKKMLSVDSDGNYRYYSGTGDKSMRGYEFFPRESLQQSGVLPGVNCPGAFLNATGEKISNDIPPPSAGLSNELLQIPDSPTSSLMLPHTQTSPVSTPTSAHRHLSSQASDRRKRKSRRSLQREKLEQTFKEKGFLIQTQQLESAEGATYCKFRQLRKFTRYLFRSWKDYLPGELQQANAAAAAAADVQSRKIVENSIINKNSSNSTEKSRKN